MLLLYSKLAVQLDLCGLKFEISPIHLAKVQSKVFRLKEPVSVLLVVTKAGCYAAGWN